MPPQLPQLKKGERLVVAGRSGSGKTTLAAFFLNRSRQHWLILNPKHTKGYAELSQAKVLHKFDAAAVSASLAKNKYTVLNLSSVQATDEYMDWIIDWLHNNFSNVGLCADELYTLHSNGRPGPGLVGWLTRGRELQQSFIGLTQRPAWVSKFVFSEANYIVGMDLTLPEDRKRMRDNTGFNGFQNRLPAHQWRWYDVERDADTLWGAVPLPQKSE